MASLRSYVIWLWLLSGPGVGLALVMAPPAVRLWFFVAAVFLETGHSFSPIVLAWTHGGFRQVMLRQPLKYLGLPAATIVATFMIADLTGLGVMMSIYWAWNIYHFGMQDFGVARLAGLKSYRWPMMIGCLGLTALGMAVLPRIAPETSLFLVGLLSFNHWAVDIGLSSRVSRYGWLFAVGVLTL